MTKVFKDDELILVFYLTNQKQEKLLGVTLNITPPTTMKGRTGVGGHDLSFTVDLGGFANVCVITILLIVTDFFLIRQVM